MWHPSLERSRGRGIALARAQTTVGTQTDDFSLIVESCLKGEGATWETLRPWFQDLSKNDQLRGCTKPHPLWKSDILRSFQA